MKNSISTASICYILLIILSGVFINSCMPTQQKSDSKDLSYLYNPIKNPINPRFNVLNQSDESTVLSVKFFASELYFSEANQKGIPIAMMLVTVKLFNISEGKQLIDTAVYNINIVKEKGRVEYVYPLPLRLKRELIIRLSLGSSTSSDFRWCRHLFPLIPVLILTGIILRSWGILLKMNFSPRS